MEATFVPGEVGREGALALWGSPIHGSVAASVTLVTPGDDGLQRRRTDVELVPVARCIDVLAALPAAAGVRPSVRAWSVAANVALDLVARGRLLPSTTADGLDTWRVGPLDPSDRVRLAELAEALPPAAHALAERDDGEPRVLAPAAAVAAFVDAVVDALVRTAAAPVAAGHEPFASTARHDVYAVGGWLRSTTGSSGSATAGLRLDLPEERGAPVRCVLEVRSTLDPGLVISAGDLWVAPPSVIARFGADVDTTLLVTLRRAARAWPPVGRLLAEARPDELELDDAEAEELFGPVADDLAAAGLPVLWPADVLRPLALRSVVTTPQPEAVTGGGLDLATVAELRWKASIDGAELTDEELAALTDAKRPMVRMRGRWVRADPEQLRRLAERRAIRTGDVLAAALSGSLTVDGEAVEAEIEGPLLALADRLRDLGDAVGGTGGARRDASPPPGLQAELRAYQRRGLAWLGEMAGLGLGGVLADDMGLGKTIQVLALHLARRGSGPTLIVCPTTLLGNWQREAARFTPDVPVRRHHGAARSLDDVAADELVVTTYGVVRRDASTLAAVPWGLVVADEAQAVKNPYSRTARALRGIGSSARIALTGTPVENRLSDLWALLDWTTPGLLGPLDAFQRNVAVPIERERDEDATTRLAATVRPFLLRRRKSDPDIAPDLPPKTETDRFVGLTTEQSTLYRAVVAELLDDVAAAEGIDRRGLVLKLLTALKQICNHPAQYLGQDGPLPGRSGKLEAVSDLLQVITDEGDSVLVFTQYVAMGRLLTAQLDSLGIESAFLHGATPVGRREEMVDDLQAGHPKVLLLSLKAGGTGLNLTRATHVVHYDRWWNPAVEDQASDRVWRIGQDRPVQVHRLVCEGTLEERIAVLLQTKRALADAVVGGGEAWVSELSDDELADLVALGAPGG